MSSIRDLSSALGAAVRAVEPSLVGLQRSRCGGASAIAWTRDLAVTAAHQVDREEGIEVTLGGERVPATLVGIDPATDIAVLRVAAELAPFGHAEPEDLAVGELVLALARPDSVRARLGVVSRLGGEWRLPGGGRFERTIESDVAPSPGFSGGPLVRASGELIGLNSAGLVRGTLVTLAASNVAKVVDALVEHGRVRRARLGVSVQRVVLPRDVVEHRKQSHGLIVLSVLGDSPADRAGVRLGDVLLELGGRRLERVEDLQNALEASTSSQTPALTRLRGGEEQQVIVELDAS